jgi:hypothetical protein
MNADVHRELEGLMAYAKAVGDRARREPDRQDVVDRGRGYIGGALTTLAHLGLLTDAEHDEWWSRLMGELPPTDCGGYSNRDSPPAGPTRRPSVRALLSV